MHFKRTIVKIAIDLCVWFSLKKKQCAKQITELSEQLDIIIVSITSIYSVKLEESSTIDHVMVIGFYTLFDSGFHWPGS